MSSKLETDTQTNRYTCVFIAALFQTAKGGHNPDVYQWMHGYIVAYLHTCYLVMKRNKVLIHAAACINLENIVLSERRHTQKVIYYRLHSYEISGIAKAIGTESRMVVSSTV